MDGLQTLTGAVEALPLDPLREALRGADAWVVGGVVRDLIAGAAVPPDIDVAVDADLEPILSRLSADGATIEVEASHARFGTATVLAGATRIDLARTRAETYSSPGALPDVSPAGIDADLARRDFTVNAMAIPLGGPGGPGGLLDPFGGVADLSARVLRVLHADSFSDDPTRAIRAARYASRLGLEPDPRTLSLLAATDLGTISDDRRRAELSRLAAESSAPAGFRLLAGWGVVELASERLDLIAAVDSLAALPPWNEGPSHREAAILLVAEGGERLSAALALAAATPERPSEAVRLCAGRDPEELLTAAAAGGGWITDYVERWRGVRLEIDGNDLLAAGIPGGPAVGAGLQGALERKLDGGLNGGREAELELAVELARRSI